MNNIFLGCIILFLLFLLIRYINTKFTAGLPPENLGEAQVRKCLLKYCKNKKAYILNNITLRLNDGSTTQIDHILISTKGIFVIETKHYKGWILANAKSKLWTQCVYHYKNQFQNPIFQNYRHVKAIQNIFPFLKTQYIYNIVVFSGKATFKTKKPNHVFYTKELISALGAYSDNILNLNDIKFCIEKLEYVRLKPNRKTDLEHQASLKKRFKS